MPTGHAALDAVLPGGGWPSQALAEVKLAREGIGEMRLVLPAVASLTRAGRQVVWVAPPYRPYAPALAAAGVDLHRLVLVRCRDAREALWAFDQALRAPECGAAFAWLAESRRAQAAPARGGRTRGPHAGPAVAKAGRTAQALAAPLRLALTRTRARSTCACSSAAAARSRSRSASTSRGAGRRARGHERAPAFGPRLPHRPVRPDPRSSAGREQAEATPWRVRRAAFQ